MNVTTGAGVSTEATRRTGDGEVGEFVLHLAGQDWTVARYKADGPTFLDTRRFSTMFLDERHKAMFHFWDSRHDTDLSAWEQLCNALNLWRLGCMSPVGSFDMPFIPHYNELKYLRNLWQSIARCG